MRESRFLCLAVSRRDGGTCIAGIDIDTGEWIRPINAKNQGALWDLEVVAKDRRTGELRMMAVLDLVNLRLGEPVGANGQPENWTLHSSSTAEPFSVLTRASQDPAVVARVRELAEDDGPFSLIFGTSDNRVSHSAIEKDPIPRSLCLIRPKKLTWVRTTNFKNKPRIEGQFDFGRRNTRFCLPLTDIVWEPLLLQQTLKASSLDATESPGMDENSELLLTVSLGDHFKETGYHYKLIAGVFLIPRK
jgi:hypothetical protein